MAFHTRHVLLMGPGINSGVRINFWMTLHQWLKLTSRRIVIKIIQVSTVDGLNVAEDPNALELPLIYRHEMACSIIDIEKVMI